MNNLITWNSNKITKMPIVQTYPEDFVDIAKEECLKRQLLEKIASASKKYQVSTRRLIVRFQWQIWYVMDREFETLFTLAYLIIGIGRWWYWIRLIVWYWCFLWWWNVISEADKWSKGIQIGWIRISGGKNSWYTPWEGMFMISCSSVDIFFNSGMMIQY